jgi:hypothetical protein
VVPLEVRREKWFQRDGALEHFTNVVRQYLDEAFGNGLDVEAQNLAPSLP